MPEELGGGVVRRQKTAREGKNRDGIIGVCFYSCAALCVFVCVYGFPFVRGGVTKIQRRNATLSLNSVLGRQVPRVSPRPALPDARRAASCVQHGPDAEPAAESPASDLRVCVWDWGGGRGPAPPRPPRSVRTWGSPDGQWQHSAADPSPPLPSTPAGSLATAPRGVLLGPRMLPEPRGRGLPSGAGLAGGGRAALGKGPLLSQSGGATSGGRARGAHALNGIRCHPSSRPCGQERAI